MPGVYADAHIIRIWLEKLWKNSLRQMYRHIYNMTPTTSFSLRNALVNYRSQWVFLANARFLVNFSGKFNGFFPSVRDASCDYDTQSNKFECIFAEFIRINPVSPFMITSGWFINSKPFYIGKVVDIEREKKRVCVRRIFRLVKLEPSIWISY